MSATFGKSPLFRLHKSKHLISKEIPFALAAVAGRTLLYSSADRQAMHPRPAGPEVRGKVVDYITHSIDDGTLYFGVWFKDKTGFSLRYACDMFVVGADFSDWKTGDEKIIRRYLRL